MDALTLHQLQCFDAVVSEGGFQAGAEKLRRSHSTVFTAIKNSEGQLGLKLLNRQGYRVALTDAGRLTRASSSTGRASSRLTPSPATRAAAPCRSRSLEEYR